MADFRSFSIIDSLLETVNSSTAAFGGPKKGVIDKAEFCSLLNQLKSQLDVDLAKAFQVDQYREDLMAASNEEHDRIINDAKTEAERIIKEANDRAEQMISQNNITVEAQRRADEIEHRTFLAVTKAKKDQEDVCEKMILDAQKECKDLKEHAIAFVTAKMHSGDQSLCQASNLLGSLNDTINQFRNEVIEQLNANRRKYSEISSNASVDEIFRENQG